MVFAMELVSSVAQRERGQVEEWHSFTGGIFICDVFSVAGFGQGDDFLSWFRVFFFASTSLSSHILSFLWQAILFNKQSCIGAPPSLIWSSQRDP